MMHDVTEIIMLGKSYLKCSTDGRKQHVSTCKIIFDVNNITIFHAKKTQIDKETKAGIDACSE